MNFICPKINFYLPLVICLLFIIFNINPEKLNALDMNTLQNEFVTEELRLKVPADMRDVWLKAEKNIWEPWLSSQDGFMGRQIFWDNFNKQLSFSIKFR